MKQYRQLIYDRIKKIYKNGEEETPVAVQKVSNPTRTHNEHKSINKDEGSYYSGEGVARHSTGKIKTASFSSTYSSFGQYHNPQSHSSFYNSTTNYYEPEEHKIQRKSSLKDILKGKKTKEEVCKPCSPLPQSGYLQKYYRKPVMNTTVYKENKVIKHI